MTTKDIEYYRAHTDELPDDEEMLNALYGEAESGKEIEPEKPAEDVEKEEKQVEDKEPEKELMARDGKNKIPYSVLENTRAELAESQRKEQDHEAELTRMRDELEALKNADSQGDDSADDNEGGEALDSLLDEYGDTSIGEQAKEQARRTETIEERLNRLEAETQDAIKAKDERDAVEYEKQVEKAINDNATLKGWRDDPDQWDSVQAVNAMLIQKEEWQNASLEELSTEIVRRLGGETKPATKGTVAEVDTSTTPTIKSLSDMPAGDAPTQTVQEEVARMSDSEFRIKYDNCRTDDERDAFLASAGM